MGLFFFAGHIQETFWLDLQQPLQVWRWLTAHWLHTDSSHLVWNGAALLLICAWLEHTSRRALVAGILVGQFSVTLWFFGVNELQLYCGASGVLNTLVVLLLYFTAVSAKQANDRLVLGVVLLVGVGLLLKTAGELLFDVRWLSVGIWPAAPGAHAAGLLGGILLVLMSPLVGNHLTRTAKL